MSDLWPFQEARKLAGKTRGQRQQAADDDEEVYDAPIVFETGFGPSGLPHLGHFSEVARTTWVRRATEAISDFSTELIVFSDDRDGLRRVPDDLPEQEMLQEHLGRPLCDIPDPHGEADSYAAYMNARLREFLDSFGFDYTFASSESHYKNGTFDEGLEAILEHAEEVREVILPTLREENRDDWSPFFPICESCGRIYSTTVRDLHPSDGTVSYTCDADFGEVPTCGHEGRVPVTGGHVKVGWKVDWALRWYALDVDYEMYGKDLIDSAKLSSQIVEILGGTRPLGFFYEMFLNAEGEKISSSEGNRALSMEDWLEYAPLESLAWFLFQNPQKAKKLHFDVIPRSVDAWLEDRGRFGDADDVEDRRDNPVWFVEHDALAEDDEIAYSCDITYTTLLNLVTALGTDDPELVWEYVTDYDPDAEANAELLEEMIDGALAYYRDFVLPEKEFQAPPDSLVAPIREFVEFLEEYEGDNPEDIQNEIYTLGEASDVELGEWFGTFYRMILGQDEGPRLGRLVYMIGLDRTIDILREYTDEE